MTTTPAGLRSRRRAPGRWAGEVWPPPSSGGSVATARSRPSIPRLPPAGGVTVSRPAPKVTMPRRLPRRAANRPTTSAAPSATSALRRSAVPKCIDGEWSSSSQAVSWRSGTSSRTCGTERPGRGVPVDPADVVARLVRPDAVEFHAGPVADDRGGRRSSGHRPGGHASARAGGRAGRRWARARVVPRSVSRPPSRPRSAEVGARGAVGHAVGSTAISRRGAGTSERTRSTIVSAVMPSARAA